MTSNLPPTRRVVTSHNDNAEAIVVFDTRNSPEPQPNGSAFVNLWCSDASPADVSSPEDKGLLEIGFVHTGSVVRIVDLPPNSAPLLHRTISLDYVIVQKGTVVLVLDDGSRTEVHEGEVVVQQATMHGWENATDGWVRLFCVMLVALPPVVGGIELGPDSSSLASG
ncbi:hypothetical protein T440DRAFT_67717 [Plenodomus tracheiphilus IPT5]|uniref:Cupin type-2 domain-containing protein n=1 Tax=Plenodomus tracheiphilus IPT5 TaxID=1408161 RepID=A0A6A7ALM9_9PLEO|nr:hypothetical protein T440DRAFT_67717 [Plenodomus tracheiphilus IPT5]